VKKSVLKKTLVVCLFFFGQLCYSIPGLTIDWEDNILTIKSPQLPEGSVQIWYLEAFCRPNSHNRDWEETSIAHKTELISASTDSKKIVLHSKLNNGVLAKHTLTVVEDGISFEVELKNPTQTPSDVAWAQPCMRVDHFTGLGQEDYLQKSFLFFDGKPKLLTELPQWSEEALYTPGQVWKPADISSKDVNPRPLSTLIPDNGLIGCFSQDDQLVLATAWEPWQELFQGVIVCLHSDFHIGGLHPNESKHIKGKIYIMTNDIDALLEHYENDF